MINPNYTQGRFLFVVDGCPHCAIWEKFISQFNMLLKPNKRVKVIDCTYYDMYGICVDPVVRLFEREIDGYPIMIINGAVKDGAENLIECKAWLQARLFNDFIFAQRNEYLPIIGKSTMFNKTCKYSQGRLICE